MNSLQTNFRRAGFGCFLLFLIELMMSRAFADPVLLVQQGRAALVAKDISTANVRFQQALSEAPTNATANLFYAATRIAILSKQTVANALMDRLGLTSTGRDIYNWQAKFATNSAGEIVVPAGVSGAELFTFVHNELIPQLIGAETNLANITSSSFIINVTAAETALGNATIDYGDIQVLRAVLRGYELFFYSVTEWNTDVQLTSLHQVFPEKITDVEALLRDYPNLLSAGSDSDLPKARAAFVAAIQTYFQGSSFIRARAAGIDRLFNLGVADLPNELKFRNDLDDLNSSLAGPVRLRSNTNLTVSASNFFNHVQGPRQYLPRFSENRWVAGTFPDWTFGGTILGLNSASIEESLADKYEPASLFSNIRVLPSLQIEISLNTAPKKPMVIDVSTNLIDWSELAQLDYAHAAQTNRWVIDDPGLATGARRFYRASSNPYNLVVLANNASSPFQFLSDAAITVSPGEKTLPLTSSPFGNRWEIPARFLPRSDFYLVKAALPGFLGQIQVFHNLPQVVRFQLSTGDAANPPQSLSGHKFAFGFILENSISFTSNSTYALNFAGHSETASYSASLDGNSWIVNLNPGGASHGFLVLSFINSVSGAISYATKDYYLGTFSQQ